MMKAAEGGIRAVTSVTLRNGPAGSVWDHINGTVLDEDHQNDRIIPNKLPNDTDYDRDFTWQRLDGFGMQIWPSNTENFLTYNCTHNLCDICLALILSLHPIEMGFCCQLILTSQVKIYLQDWQKRICMPVKFYGNNSLACSRLSKLNKKNCTL